MNEEAKRDIALLRARELKARIEDYLLVKESIARGTSPEQEVKISGKKERILKVLGADEKDWNDWKWQISNRISEVDILVKIIKLDASEIENIKKVQQKYRWSISPYYLSLIDDDDKFNPVKLQAVPSILELRDGGSPDPMSEEYTNPAGCITRRYPDRLVINVTNECPSYCRHCQRRRNIGTVDRHQTDKMLKESLEYIRENPEIRDVLITGGDPLTLSDEKLDWLLEELRDIPSVEIIRIGTRVPVTMPQRVTEELVAILKKYPPLYINTQFNHPLEITKAAKEASWKLAEAGIPLSNQSVLLNGINDDKFVMRLLNQELLKCRIRPYYLFHGKSVSGTTHFNTPVSKGIEIMEYLRGYTSGMAIPAFIVNLPGGNGKIPLLPQYIVSEEENTIKIRNWEGKIIEYQNPGSMDMKELLTNNEMLADCETVFTGNSEDDSEGNSKVNYNDNHGACCNVYCGDDCIFGHEAEYEVDYEAEY